MRAGGSTLAKAFARAAWAVDPAWKNESPRTDFNRRTVKLEEIISGGPSREGISAIDKPRFVAPQAAIRARSQRALCIERIPALWRALAHPPRQLEATGRTNRLVLESSVLDETTKAGAALAVAQCRQSGYWIAYLTRFLRVSCGFDDRALVEATAMMMRSLSFDTIAHGMHLEAPMNDLAAADFGPADDLQTRQGRAGSPLQVRPQADKWFSEALMLR